MSSDREERGRRTNPGSTTDGHDGGRVATLEEWAASDSPGSESAAGVLGRRERDAARDVRLRAQYLAATTILTLPEAETLAWRERGHSHAAIARKVGNTKPMVTARLERIVARYGLDTITTKPRHQRGETDLEPVTRAEIAAYHVVDRRYWYDAATTHIERAPAWFRAWVGGPSGGGRA